jgi:predicted hydrocarbon binding protein
MMVDQTRDRFIYNRFMRLFFQAVEEQIGAYSLHMMLRQAGLDRYVDHLPPNNRRAEIRSGEYAQFQKAIRSYYGKGARGSLNRIGRRVFQRMEKEAIIPDKIRLFGIRIFPLSMRRIQILAWLAGQLQRPDGKITVHTFDQELIFVVHSNDSTCGQTEHLPVCWVTQGMLQESLLWATGEESDIEEICCQAAGGETCTFRIQMS